MSLYLAYGSNINPVEFKEYSEKPRFVGANYLPDYQLVFDGCSTKRGGMVADIRKKQGYKVPCVIWEITNKNDIEKLDRKEGFTKGGLLVDNIYNKVTLNFPPYGETFAYTMTRKMIEKYTTSSKIPPEYINEIREGYRLYKLDESYLNDAVTRAKIRL